MSASHSLLLSPAELAYLHHTLSLSPRPIRPDGRSATQFRPLTAETGILPGTNGSARVCFADGTEAVVGVKAEVEKTHASPYADRGPVAKVGAAPRPGRQTAAAAGDGKEEAADQDDNDAIEGAVGSPDWLELTVEIPGLRDDDSGTVFLSAMLREALLADGALTKKLFINRRFHWKLYVDVVLISPPLAYPLPLLSLTTHLALLATQLPRLRSEADEDPMFDDDWAAAPSLYGAPPHSKRHNHRRGLAARARPPITLLVMAVGDNIIFDPTKDELAVADSALAVSVAEGPSRRDLAGDDNDGEGAMDVDKDEQAPGRNLKVLAVRTIDPPSRLTAPGVPNEVNAAAWGTSTAAGTSKNPDARVSETENVTGVWKAPRGGAKLGMLAAMVAKVLEKGGVADQVLDGLEGVELG